MEDEILTADLKGHRTLATVVFTDCVGFSARMSVDEEHTLDLIRRDLALMKRICEQFEGRVLKTTGDGLLMCFSSAVKAVECAIATQQAIGASAIILPPKDYLMHRIGIHLADMYITATDVMGNGVNIAARLQTEADPGGICISQTVYDVAKHVLQLDTHYLGPRELKNIREVVPAYKILLNPEDAIEDPYDEAAKKLFQSANLARIKKLLFYVCKNRWETDSIKLDAIHLKGLFQEFLGLASNVGQLSHRLETAIRTLSKQTEYALVAKELLSEAHRFYPPTQSNQDASAQDLPVSDQTRLLPTPVAATPQRREMQPIYQQIAYSIDRGNDPVRLKKLLFYICHRQWESDLTRLTQFDTASLVQEIHSLAVNGNQLRQTLAQFVQTLNKSAEYEVVGQGLIVHLLPLYPEIQVSIVESTKASETQSIADAADVSYQDLAYQIEQSSYITRFKKLMVYVCKNQWISDSKQLEKFDTTMLLKELHTISPTIERLKMALDAVVKTLSKRTEYTLIATELTNSLGLMYAEVAVLERSPDQTQLPPPVSKQAQLPSPVSKQETHTPLQSDSDQALKSVTGLFDVRLGILKYTNPLRAKILVFSTLYSDFTFSREDWLDLKMYELDGLLRELIQNFQTYTDLEAVLYSTARRLPEPEEGVQTADTIIKCVRTLYLHGNPASIFGNSEQATRITLDDFEESTQGSTMPEANFGQTQLLTSSVRSLDTSEPWTNSTQLLSVADDHSAKTGIFNAQE
ncbi:adenylate/guanylate cyclase domain-containing protein [Leptolyngbya sp. Cla-17]|uniref:adenylate/guanylate cyclase domain-containing protein n=1 Tax=Leptolyngbya sp. Cla-17 TaxID=2803751 RepID=UPI0018D927E3|nr:adenylate/guanylate cyclase domain-containing protein [Leptolyngbya sp. Cla-17]